VPGRGMHMRLASLARMFPCRRSRLRKKRSAGATQLSDFVRGFCGRAFSSRVLCWYLAFGVRNKNYPSESRDAGSFFSVLSCPFASVFPAKGVGTVAPSRVKPVLFSRSLAKCWRTQAFRPTCKILWFRKQQTRWQKRTQTWRREGGEVWVRIQSCAPRR